MSIAMDGKLYIFNGFAVEERKKLASRPWAEVFDPRTESSHPLPSPLSLGLLRCGFFGFSVCSPIHPSKRILVATPTLNVAGPYACIMSWMENAWKQLDHNISTSKVKWSKIKLLLFEIPLCVVGIRTWFTSS